MNNRSLVFRAATVCSAAAVACVVAVACNADRGQAPPSANPALATVASGDGQRAVAGQPLGDAIAVQVLDRAGAPAPGIGVDWVVQQDSDVVHPRHSVTASTGIATTTWTLGPLPGDHTVLANVSGLGSVEVHASADPAPLVINSVHLLSLVTPDGSGQTVHPDYVAVPDDAPLAGNFLAITPYPYNNERYEDPSLYASLDRIHWNPPAGGVNPLEYPTHGFLSDPDIVYNPDSSQLWVYYREVTATNNIYLIKSSDAVTWTAPQPVAFAPDNELVSPAVVRMGPTDWMMWSVNGQYGCTAPDTWVELRRSSDGVSWSDPQRVSLTQPGFTPWHIDVQWIPTRSEYWAVYNVKTQSDCSTPALYLATSADGMTWKTYPSPVLARGDIDAFRDIVYRSTFHYRPDLDAITFWYSGAAFGDSARLVWRSAVQRRPRAEVFSAISRLPAAGLMSRMNRHVPALLDPP